jgi:branched-chain amino acid transport system permease protein
MVESKASLRGHLDERYPRASKKVPDSVVSPLEYLFRAWRKIGYGRYLVAAAIMAAIPFLMEYDLIPYLQGGFGTNILFLTGVYVLLALGLNVVVGFAGLLDLGYVAFFMLGAYTTALMTPSGAADQFHFVEWSPWAVLPIAVLVAMVAGAALGIPTLRLRGDYLAIVTLGFHEIVRISMNNLEVTNGSRGIIGIPHPDINLFGFKYEFSGVDSSPYWWFLLIPAILLAVLMIRHLDDSRVGRYWTAIREDEVAAAAMGVPVVKMKVLAFVIGASTGGVAGWIYAVKLNFISPQNFPLLASILVLSAVVAGGLGSISGAALGAALVITIPEIVRSATEQEAFLGFNIDTGRVAIFGFLLIILMIFRPGGLLAPRRRRTEMRQAGAADAVVSEAAVEKTAAEADVSDAHKVGG